MMATNFISHWKRCPNSAIMASSRGPTTQCRWSICSYFKRPTCLGSTVSTTRT
ncbi:ORF2b' protein [Pebjah virus]|uniref:ORF2b' protein n=1 Tax=Pebjah virus TaxID=1658615 RepID=A0A0G2UH69_9NIDO|nr:ORF2b' protein [Pebjah virus]AKI29928.1 ORF2b' protein [Pebjah virus]AKI29943.1 ORF2b' protein [Pebjah virus]AKI29958.1 ORF2b' protein [Pebjah virus]